MLGILSRLTRLTSGLNRDTTLSMSIYHVNSVDTSLLCPLPYEAKGHRKWEINSLLPPPREELRREKTERKQFRHFIQSSILARSTQCRTGGVRRVGDSPHDEQEEDTQALESERCHSAPSCMLLGKSVSLPIK